MRFLVLVAGLALTACGGADTPAVQQNAQVSNNESASAPDAEPQTEAQREYAAANDRMHAGMGKIDADPDVAFMQGMIPHHRGAVEMAQIVLIHGKDPEARALAQSVIAAQKAEIAQMERWLAKRGATTGAGDAGAHAGH